MDQDCGRVVAGPVKARMVANVPENMRGQPLTVGNFLRFMELLINSNKALKKRVVQLEEKVNGQGDGHG